MRIENGLQAAFVDLSRGRQYDIDFRMTSDPGIPRSSKSLGQRPYLDALGREIDLVSELLPSNASVRRIAFGDGSPNAISPDEFLALVDRLIARFGIDDPAFSIELDTNRSWQRSFGYRATLRILSKAGPHRN